MRFPWADRTGRTVPLKLVIFLALFVPGLWVAYALATGQLGAQPLKAATRELGTMGLRLFMLSLAVSPLRSLWHWPTAMLIRRMLGVGAFAYLALHFTMYVASQGFVLATVASEIVLRIYLTIGFVALLGLAALAATSTDGMIKRLGGKNWRRLHKLAYPLGVLAIVHFFLQARLDAIETQITAGLFVWAMAWRVAKAQGQAGWAVTLALGIAAALLVPLAEAGFIAVKLGAPFWMVFAANFDPELAPRPAHVILGFVGAVCAVAFARARP